MKIFILLTMVLFGGIVQAEREGGGGHPCKLAVMDIIKDMDLTFSENHSLAEKHRYWRLLRDATNPQINVGFRIVVSEEPIQNCPLTANALACGRVRENILELNCGQQGWSSLPKNEQYKHLFHELFWWTPFDDSNYFYSVDLANDHLKSIAQPSPIESSFELARMYLSQAISSYDKNAIKQLSERSRRIIEEHRGQLTAELLGTEIQYDHVTREPFIQEDGSKTAIQTKLNAPFAPIEVRTKVLAPRGNLDIKITMSLLSHEIGQHLPSKAGFEKKEKAGAVATALFELLNATIKYPQLLSLSGDYMAVEGSVKCRDIAHIEADPFSGSISVATFTLGACVYLGESYSESGTIFFKKKKNKFIVKSSNDRDNYINRTELFVLPDGGVQVHFSFGSEASGIGRFNRVIYPLYAWEFDQKYVKQK